MSKLPNRIKIMLKKTVWRLVEFNSGCAGIVVCRRVDGTGKVCLAAGRFNQGCAGKQFVWLLVDLIQVVQGKSAWPRLRVG